MSDRTRPRGRPSRITPFVHLIGVLPDREVAALANCTPANISMYRRRKQLPEAPPAVSDGRRRPAVSRGSLLDAYASMIGVLPDAAVAEAAGCTAANVSLYRRRRGIPSSIAHRVITPYQAPPSAPSPRPTNLEGSSVASLYEVKIGEARRFIVAASLAEAQDRAPPGALLAWVGTMLG